MTPRGEQTVLLALALLALAGLAVAAWLLLDRAAAATTEGGLSVDGAEDLIAGCIRITREAADGD